MYFALKGKVSFWRAPCKGGVFPVGERPTRLSLQPEAIGTVSIVASETFPATPGMSFSGRLCPLPILPAVVDREEVERQVTGRTPT
jgi:hypothetical protein